jgi:hypothetical protein
MKRASKLGTALLFLALCACEDGFLVIRTGVFAGSSGFCSAMINDANWNCSQSSGQVSGGGIIIIFGTGRDPFGRQVDLSLTMHSTVGSAVQRIGADDIVSAEVVMYDYGQTRTWSAGGSQGSGAFRLTSLTAESAAGTFEFAAPPAGQSLAMTTYRITSGTFNVQLR